MKDIEISVFETYLFLSPFFENVLRFLIQQLILYLISIETFEIVGSKVSWIPITGML